MKYENIAEFSQGLALLLEANIPLADALSILGEDEYDHFATPLVIASQKARQQGGDVADGWVHCSSQFPAFLLPILRAGEKQEKLPQVLQDISKFLANLDRIEANRYRIWQELSHLAFPFFFLLLILSVLALFTFPQFTDLYQSMGVPLPETSQQVFLLGNLILHYGWIILFLLAISLFLLFKLLTHLSWLRRIQPKLLMLLPWSAKRYQMIIAGRFSLAASLALRYGSSWKETIALAAALFPSKSYCHYCLLAISSKIEHPECLAKALDQCALFPRKLIRATAIAAQSSTPDTLYRGLAEYYLAHTEQQTKRGPASLLQTVLFGALLGYIIIGLYLPIFKLGSAILGE